MGIQKDAGEILLLIYKHYMNNVKILGDDGMIAKETAWEKARIDRAIYYLEGKDLLEIQKFIGEGYLITNILPSAIDTIEDQEKFKKQFNFTVNLGLFQFSWGASQK